jgi:hypothetical protein
LDPTAASACARRGPRRELGSRVHGGPATQNERVRDLARLSQVSQPRTHAGEGQWRACQSAVARSGSSPAGALLEADLKMPITTSCSTCELHAVKNLDLAKCVGRLQD